MVQFGKQESERNWGSPAILINQFSEIIEKTGLWAEKTASQKPHSAKSCLPVWKSEARVTVISAIRCAKSLMLMRETQ
jgi:hypothetical protein